MAKGSDLTELTTWIVASFVANNRITTEEIPALIASTHAALQRVQGEGELRPLQPSPAVAIEESVTYDHIVCLNDGRKLKSLKRYIKRKYALTPEKYREMWHLPDDYPMVAPAYSEYRSRIAKGKRAIGDDAGHAG